jgi:hypothetical protein
LKNFAVVSFLAARHLLKCTVHGKPQIKCNIRNSFATVFKNWRRKHNVPLKQIATDLGLSIATINKWERGERFPTGRHFEMLSDYTGQPPCRLFCIMAAECRPAGCLLLAKD